MSVKSRRHYDIEKNVRDKIEVIKLLNRLSNHALNDDEMSPTQVRAAEILLKKVLPDLSSTEHSGTVAFKRANEMADDELAAIAVSGSEGITEAPLDPSKLN